MPNWHCCLLFIEYRGRKDEHEEKQVSRQPITNRVRRAFTARREVMRQAKTKPFANAVLPSANVSL